MADNGLVWRAFASLPLIGRIMHLADEGFAEGTFKPADYPADRYFRSKRTGLLVYHRAWTVPQPKAIVYLSHGIAEYCERYEHVAAALNACGCTVYALDHQGHGKSEGQPRQYFSRLDDLVSDLLQLVHEVRPAPAGVPRFLLGHSMGALVSLLALRASMMLEQECSGSGAGAAAEASPAGAASQQHGAAGKADSALSQYGLSRSSWIPSAHSQAGWGGWAGLILSGPGLVFDPNIDTPFNRFLARSLASVLPKLEVQALDPDQIAADKAVVLQYQRDPLVAHGPLRVRVGFEMMKGVETVRGWAATATLPLLCVHGSEDKLCDIKGSEWLMSAVASPDKSLIRYPGLRHEIFNEKEKEKVLSDVCGWIGKHV